MKKITGNFFVSHWEIEGFLNKLFHINLDDRLLLLKNAKRSLCFSHLLFVTSLKLGN